MWITDEDDALIDELWADAPSDPTVLSALLETAEDQCKAWAPALAEDAPIPARYKVAVIMQARAIQRSLVTGGGDLVGEGYTVTVYPMDRTVKALLRPPRPERVF